METTQLKNSTNPLKNAIMATNAKKRTEEYQLKGNKNKTVRCFRPKSTIDPILYLPASSRDRHRLIKWASLLKKLIDTFGNSSLIQENTQPIDYIMNKLPRSEVGLHIESWKQVWPALIGILREIDRLSHPDVDFDEEQDPANSLEPLVSSISQATA